RAGWTGGDTGSAGELLGEQAGADSLLVAGRPIDGLDHRRLAAETVRVRVPVEAIPRRRARLVGEVAVRGISEGAVVPERVSGDHVPFGLEHADGAGLDAALATMPRRWMPGLVIMTPASGVAFS